MIGRVYQIKHKTLPICYVGSTTNTLHRRWLDHGCSFRAWMNGNKVISISMYPHMRTHGMDQFEMLLLQEYHICDKQHLRAYEQLWVNKLSSVNKKGPFNLLSPGMNRVMRLRYNKDTYAKTKDERNKKWICECGSSVSKNSLNYHNQSKRHMLYIEVTKRHKKRGVASSNHQTIDLLMERLAHSYSIQNRPSQ